LGWLRNFPKRGAGPGRRAAAGPRARRLPGGDGFVPVEFKDDAGGFLFGAAVGLQLQQFAEAAADLALEVALVAGQFEELIAKSATDPEGPGARVAAALLVEALGHGVGFEAQIEDAGFHAGEAAEAPVGGGHAFDQALLDFGGRLPVGAEARDEGLEIGGVFVREEVFFGGEAVEEAVAAGAFLAFRGARPGGLLGVTPVGVDLCL
jgi:hypothetical protein